MIPKWRMHRMHRYFLFGVVIGLVVGLVVGLIVGSGATLVILELLGH